MKVKEFKDKFEQLQKENPNLDIDELEVGPLFSGGVIMMTSNLTLSEDGAWEKHDKNEHKAIALVWHC